MRRLATLLAAGALALITSISAPTQAEDRYNQQISTFRAVLTEQASLDEAGLSVDARALLEQWLQEAESLLQSGDRAGASRRLKRVEDGMELVRALVLASQITAEAARQEQGAASAAEQVGAMKSEVESLVNRRQALQNQLRQLQ